MHFIKGLHVNNLSESDNEEALQTKVKGIKETRRIKTYKNEVIPVNHSISQLKFWNKCIKPSGRVFSNFYSIF